MTFGQKITEGRNNTCSRWHWLFRMQTEASRDNEGLLALAWCRTNRKLETFTFTEEVNLRVSFHNWFLHMFNKERTGWSAAFQLLWIYCTEQLLLLKRQNVSHMFMRSCRRVITSFFTVLLISDTFRKYQDFLEVIFSLVLNVNSKIMGLGCREVDWQSKSL